MSKGPGARKLKKVGKGLGVVQDLCGERWVVPGRQARYRSQKPFPQAPARPVGLSLEERHDGKARFPFPYPLRKTAH